MTAGLRLTVESKRPICRPIKSGRASADGDHGRWWQRLQHAEVALRSAAVFFSVFNQRRSEVRPTGAGSHARSVSVLPIAANVASDYGIGRISLQLMDVRVVSTAKSRAIFVVQNGIATHICVFKYRSFVVSAADFHYQSYSGSALRDTRVVGGGRRGAWIVSVVGDQVILD